MKRILVSFLAVNIVIIVTVFSIYKYIDKVRFEIESIPDNKIIIYNIAGFDNVQTEYIEQTLGVTDVKFNNFGTKSYISTDKYRENRNNYDVGITALGKYVDENLKSYSEIEIVVGRDIQQENEIVISKSLAKEIKRLSNVTTLDQILGKNFSENYIIVGIYNDQDDFTRTVINNLSFGINTPRTDVDFFNSYYCMSLSDGDQDLNFNYRVLFSEYYGVDIESYIESLDSNDYQNGFNQFAIVTTEDTEQEEVKMQIESYLSQSVVASNESEYSDYNILISKIIFYIIVYIMLMALMFIPQIYKIKGNSEML